MSDESKSCPKCSQPMQVGWVMEQHATTRYPNVWVEGSPEPSFLTLTKTKGKDLRMVLSYRCVGCGFLESYATHEWTGNVNPA